MILAATFLVGFLAGIAITLWIARPHRQPPRHHLDPLPPWPPPLSAQIQSAILDHHRRHQ